MGKANETRLVAKLTDLLNRVAFRLSAVEKRLEVLEEGDKEGDTLQKWIKDTHEKDGA